MAHAETVAAVHVKTGIVSGVKVVINKCYGGFGLSKAAVELYNELTPGPKMGWHYEKNPIEGFYPDDVERDDPILVKVVETLGEAANGFCANLVVVDAEEDWEISEHDGAESIEYNWRY